MSLTTHVLDTKNGRPAAGIKIELWSVEPRKLLRKVKTNSDGRTDEPLLLPNESMAGRIRAASFTSAIISVNASFSTRSRCASKFLTRPRKYHVPLLVSPWAYSTYRGS